jgi:TolB-like protein/Flp pilus assembly protein TadD
MAEEQRQLAAIMFTDMDDFSALAQRNEPLALELLEEHFQLLRPLFPKHDGRELKTIGDAFMAEFASPLQAVRCAIAMQKVLSIQNAASPPERQIKIRIGIHLGDIEHRGGDVFGDGVNIASRIEPLAEPGGICISQQVYDHIQNKIDHPLVSIGKPPLKNIQMPIEIYQVVLPWQSLTRASTQPTHHATFIETQRESIAVLPFVNLSPDPENEYFSDGLTEELIDALTKVDGLHVAARSSAFMFKGKTEDIRKIGEQLNVKTVLEGSVRKAGTKLRVTAQLITIADGYHLWSESYNRDMADIFAVQEEIARTIVNTLKVKLVGEQDRPLVKCTTENLEAYQLYLKGRYFWNKRTEEGLKKGVEHFEQAIAKDPNYALAHVGLADCNNVLGALSYLHPKDAFSAAKLAAKRALELDESLSEAHASLAFVTFRYDWDWLQATKEFARALELNPNYPEAHHWYALYLLEMGQFDAALAEMNRAQELDPLSLVINANRGWILYCARQCDQAIEQCRKTLEMDPNFARAHLWLGQVYGQKGLYNEAIEELQKANLLDDSTLILARLGHVYAISGQRGAAQKVLGKLKEVSKRRYVSPVDTALIYFGLGEKEQAFEWLERAYEEHFFDHVFLKVEPMLDSQRSDPRYMELLKKMGLEK